MEHSRTKCEKKKFFGKAGILNHNFQVVSRVVCIGDPFLGLEGEEEMLQDEEVNFLISQLQVENPCTANEVTLVDDDLAICADLSDDKWEEDFLAAVCPSSTKSSRTEDKVVAVTWN